LTLFLSSWGKKKSKMKVHIIGGGNLGVSIAIGLAKFSKNNLRE
jgi:NADH dehydrogenase FAD-containing subunit